MTSITKIRRNNIMPNVNGKKFKYTAKGMAKAKAEAKKKGVKVKYGK